MQYPARQANVPVRDPGLWRATGIRVRPANLRMPTGQIPHSRMVRKTERQNLRTETAQSFQLVASLQTALMRGLRARTGQTSMTRNDGLELPPGARVK